MSGGIFKNVFEASLGHSANLNHTGTERDATGGSDLQLASAHAEATPDAAHFAHLEFQSQMRTAEGQTSESIRQAAQGLNTQVESDRAVVAHAQSQYFGAAIRA